MVGRWSEATTLKFIYYYKLNECLWNTKSPLYAHKQSRDAAYTDLVTHMAMDDFDVRAAKVKIKNLRAHYFTELKKVRNGMAIGNRYEPTLYWFKEMDSFIKDVVGDIPSLQQPEVIIADSIYDSSCIYENGVGDFDEDSMGKASPIFHMAPDAVRANAAKKARSSNGTSNQRKKKRPAQDSIDEFDVFGKSVAAQLRKLSVARALRAQTQIQTMLTEERLHDLETTSPPLKPITGDIETSGNGGGSLLVPESTSISGGLLVQAPPSIDIGSGLLVHQPTSLGDLLVKKSTSTSSVNNIFDKNSNFGEADTHFDELKPSQVTEIHFKPECDVITLDEDDPFEGH